ncbi:hypothetical protein F5882DRAFT_470022 [Hyaloscypha sp. PMI_1271]|nr:hypothetical protein F5882DRAFT_470022 [Hyaloscypha sp. PMI_1271]
MNHIAVIVALAFFTKLIFALSPNYPFDQLPRPIHLATFTGEVNDHAYELNGTHIQEQLKKLYPGVQFPKHDITNEPEVLTTRNKDGVGCINSVSGALQGAEATNILQCINFLHSPDLGRIICPGNSCVSMCCINGDNLWLCNYNNFAIDPALDYLASYAYDIEQSCTEDWTDPGVWIAGGHDRDTDGYAVWVLGWNGQGGHGC